MLLPKSLISFPLLSVTSTMYGSPIVVATDASSIVSVSSATLIIENDLRRTLLVLKLVSLTVQSTAPSILAFIHSRPSFTEPVISFIAYEKSALIPSMISSKISLISFPLFLISSSMVFDVFMYSYPFSIIPVSAV